MISEIDEALRSLVRAEAIAGSDLDVVFDAPTKDWAARRNAPTINLYLYDVREDVRRREQGWRETRGVDGVVTSRRPMPRHFKLSYLVTAWTQRPEDEHRLLSELLRCFVRQDVVPAEFLTGSLAEPGVEIPLTVALPPPEDRAFADVWSALGGELKPSLDVVLVAPIDVGVPRPAGPPVREGPRLDLSDRTTEAVDFDRFRHHPDGPPRTERPSPPGDGLIDRHEPGAPKAGPVTATDKPVIAARPLATTKGRARTPRTGRRT
ncbi:MAG: Pvc16 family protein [Humibacillus sp.]|nr:Pvc16 family protein [Humibacillus sp.]MDN5779270.1 Pvc16 family protein [Humibacillus sp.]